MHINSITKLSDLARWINTNGYFDWNDIDAVCKRNRWVSARTWESADDLIAHKVNKEGDVECLFDTEGGCKMEFHSTVEKFMELWSYPS